ncbi:hypothetical protein M409DRAFT_21489 [Zasmidium cellare ATCC 36951]|uniref:F-box domain-containing protein n=1 Tax=Zasmidium cellare ATCC 36951 TaxID=1080233 RepID=A0A6A6CN36_ZASCE|nr:uncharacterized protein M409DRAFT_21489 [Zasmidium cellare ATCC 36951]KAF2168043.1 hypothetical protein M409DRAFT_21489 [Zasmidium cellare ATCC 36951]
MGAASLESLTNELFEHVVQHLDLNDIRNLRLASRSTAFKAAQDTYRTFFQMKHVELRRENLEKFVRITAQGGMGCLVEHLTLMAIVYHQDPLRKFIRSGGEKPPQRR